MSLGSRVKEARERKGLSQTELAELMGYKSRSSINKIESGERDIPRSSLIQLAEKLDVTPQYLMGWTDEITPDSKKEQPEPELSETDRSALELFQQLDADSKKMFIQLMKDRLK